MPQKLSFLVVLISINVSAQLMGEITDNQGNPLRYVTVFLENSYYGIASNDDGFYSLYLPENPEKNEFRIGFRALGYKTVFKSVPSFQKEYILNVILL